MKPQWIEAGSGLPCFSLTLLQPEKGSFAVTKTLQIGVSVVAFVICRVCDQWLQGLCVKATERSKSLTVRIMWSIILCLLCFRGTLDARPNVSQERGKPD